ncbi:MAG TPA: acetylglutamate kinase [Spirochaetales bacterium]|nr:acetylglutamate kinase [Spirochaetales bacterium]HPS15300.1 acetylglutamate kinase [Spirochaetales bacterium]
MISDMMRADILIQAMPYFRAFAGKVIVVKFGGAAMINEGVRSAVLEDLILMQQVGIKPVLVHGGGPEIDRMLKRLGKERVFVNGLRYTDDDTMDIVQMVLAGKINKDLVANIQRQGGSAIGLCGGDGGLFRAKRLIKDEKDIGLVGEVDEVNPALVNLALANGYIPVVSTIALREDGEQGYYNVNADTAAAELAGSLKAEKLMLLTDVPGILKDTNDASTLVPAIKREEVSAYIVQGIVSGGMIPKVECCVQALRLGVKSTHILDGRSPHSILLELFSDKGMGTMIV